MTPRLILLTGPAAEEVWDEVFNAERDDFETRDYLAALDMIARGSQHQDVNDDYVHGDREKDEHLQSVAEVIRSLPGGEAWLVGLVLPPVPHGWGYVNTVVSTQDWGYVSTQDWGYGRVKQKFDWVASPLYQYGPSRLAILAPEPPALLVERVLAWGGEVWDCSLNPTPGDLEHGPKPCRIFVDPQGVWDTPVDEDTWPEAVRAALGEAK